MNDTHRELMGERGAELFLDLSGDDGKGLLHGVRAAHAILDESCHLPCEVVSPTKATTRQMNAIHKFTSDTSLSVSERLMSSRSDKALPWPCWRAESVPRDTETNMSMSTLQSQDSSLSTNCPVTGVLRTPQSAARSHSVILF